MRLWRLVIFWNNMTEALPETKPQNISPDTPMGTIGEDGQLRYTRTQHLNFLKDGKNMYSAAKVIDIFTKDPSLAIDRIAELSGLTIEQVNEVITTDLASQFWQDVRKVWVMEIAKLVPKAIKTLETFTDVVAPRNSKLNAAKAILGAIGIDVSGIKNIRESKDDKRKATPSQVIINVRESKEPITIESKVVK